MRPQQDAELDLAVRCAWQAFIIGRTHEEIAERIGTSRTRVTRLIQLAQRAGLVKVFVEGPAAACVALEEKLSVIYGLHECSVAPDLDEAGLPIAALGSLGGRLLATILQREGLHTIGIGHGRTLAAAVNALPILNRPDLRLVSLLGSLTRGAATNPYEVIFRLADRTGGRGYYVPAPFFCNSETDRAIFLQQRDLRAALDLAAQAQVLFVGIGSPRNDRGMTETGMVTEEELRTLVKAGAIGEILGTFVNAKGEVLDLELSRRAIAPSLNDMRGKEVIAIAGGPSKIEAVDAVLRAGVITHLVTDETTARALAGRAAQAKTRAGSIDGGGNDVDESQGPGARVRKRPRQPA
jgi:DNA-binding transcriptional regulator LsrR (DeoR family)